MNVTREQIGEVAIVAPRVDFLDAGNAREFRRAFAALIEPGARMVLDLSRVEFIDSSGCGAILSSLKQLTTVGGELKLCAVTGPVRSLFELICLHKVFDILNTREEAVRAFALEPLFS
jgi:anti-sigma B factor antagonist